MDLGGNKLGPEGGTALASALKVNAVLKKLDVQYNRLGDGEEALRNSVKDREGFELCV